MKRNGFVCAINGARDVYQVPAALAEGGLLRRFVTDYYAPENPPGWLPGAMRRRSSPFLPARLVRNAPLCFAVQHGAARLGVPMHRIWPHTDAMLGRLALRQAVRLDAHLHGYAGYLPRRSAMPRGMRMIDFEYHPHPALALELLREDAARHPEVVWSFARERDAAARAWNADSWRDADAVVCASRMTARALEFAGCDPARITVVPYGIQSDGGGVTARPPGEPVRFLFVGQGIQRKGLHHLLRAWREVDPRRARLTLACYAIDPGIATLADQPGVELRGRQEKAGLADLMRAAHVFIMPSLVEGFGLVYLEALAAGCHVVGTANTGLPDLPLDGTARTLVPAGDVAGLGVAIESLIARHEGPGIDATAIAAQAASWTWADFRAGIAAHADGINA